MRQNSVNFPTALLISHLSQSPKILSPQVLQQRKYLFFAAGASALAFAF
jgi:hypothetical protein